jgi:putative transcriptional regulator
MEDPVRALRDRTGTTRLLILAELHKQPGATLSDVAKSMGITVQAVSAHARQLAAKGWLRHDEGGYAVAARGVQALHEGIRHLRDAVQAMAQPLDVIQVASAIALEPVRAGQDVGLFMVEGDLAAKPGADAPSRGKAQNAAKAGGEVVVSDLRGIVQLEPGRLTVLVVPGPAEGGSGQVDVPALRRVLDRRSRTHRIGAHGTGARILARGLAAAGSRPPDFEFAADRAAFNAAERGLDVLLFVTRDRLAEVMDGFSRLNQETLRRVPVEVLEAPERHG